MSEITCCPGRIEKTKIQSRRIEYINIFLFWGVNSWQIPTVAGFVNKKENATRWDTMEKMKHFVKSDEQQSPRVPLPAEFQNWFSKIMKISLHSRFSERNLDKLRQV